MSRSNDIRFGWHVGWRRACGVLVALGALVAPLSYAAQSVEQPSDVRIARTAGAIKVDGDLSDPGWQDAARVDKWYETTPGDNTPPQVESVAYLTYDDKFLYAAFEFSDPDPAKIRAPFGEQDSIAIAHDYGGLYIDAANDGKTAVALLTTARGVQYDAVRSDATDIEDAAPDFYWDSAAKITATGWALEMRVPFSSLRYPHTDPQTWGIMLYRNWPRGFRYQMYSVPLLRGTTCIVCQAAKLTGLSDLPRGGHWLFAPYATARQSALPMSGPGSDLNYGSIETEVGIDAKWTPNADTAVDLTINPDFSQVEADVAQVEANERFALSYPEKRPFFLEGKDLFSTPIPAVYTRTITDPDWGLRGTGRFGSTSYTALVTNDAGGGRVILPGPSGSRFANQDFRSVVGVARARYDIDRSYISLLATTREADGGAYNRVIGPDFTWRYGRTDRVTGQLLYSDSVTPNRPDLTSQWDGRRLQSHAGRIEWTHTLPTYDWLLRYFDYGDEFRADNGFVPQVGFRQGYAETTYTFRPQDSFFSRIRPFVYSDHGYNRDDAPLWRYNTIGVAMDGDWNSYLRFRYANDHVRSGARVLPRDRFIYKFEFNPSRVLSRLLLEGSIGQAIDFDNSRSGHGGNVVIGASLRPTDHIELTLSGERRWVDVPPDSGGPERHLFTAHVLELRTTYTFTARSYLRLIAQYIATARDPTLYRRPVTARDKDLLGTGLFAYKLNWQSVLFVGYGDTRENSPQDDGWDKASRQWFLKVSYAFQPK